MSGDTFIPHAHCTVASGDCFAQGQCLRACQEQHTRNQDKRIHALESRVRDLEQQLHRLKSGTTKY